MRSFGQRTNSPYLYDVVKLSVRSKCKTISLGLLPSSEYKMIGPWRQCTFRLEYFSDFTSMTLLGFLSGVKNTFNEFNQDIVGHRLECGLRNAGEQLERVPDLRRVHNRRRTIDHLPTLAIHCDWVDRKAYIFRKYIKGTIWTSYFDSLSVVAVSFPLSSARRYKIIDYIAVIVTGEGSVRYLLF